MLSISYYFSIPSIPFLIKSTIEKNFAFFKIFSYQENTINALLIFFDI
jgi:hypothetical protein